MTWSRLQETKSETSFAIKMKNSDGPEFTLTETDHGLTPTITGRFFFPCNSGFGEGHKLMLKFSRRAHDNRRYKPNAEPALYRFGHVFYREGNHFYTEPNITLQDIARFERQYPYVGYFCEFHFKHLANSSISLLKKVYDLKSFIDAFLECYGLLDTPFAIDLNNFCGSLAQEERVEFCLKQIEGNNFKPSVDTALRYQAGGYQQLVWQVGQRLLATFDTDPNQDVNQLNHIMELFEKITATNPHYPEAQSVYLNLLMRLPVTPENQIELLEKKFKAAKNSNQPDLACRFYDELCGNSISLDKLDAAKISGDNNTLCQSASDMRLKNLALRKQAAENEALLLKLLAAEKILADFQAASDEIKNQRVAKPTFFQEVVLIPDDEQQSPKAHRK